MVHGPRESAGSQREDNAIRETPKPRIPTLLVALTAIHATVAAAHQPVAGPVELGGRFERAQVTTATAGERPNGTRAATLRLLAFGHEFVVDLLPSPVLATAPSLYQGTVRGDPDSRVALMVTDGVIDGSIRAGDEIYFFEPARRFDRAAAETDVIAYRLSDLSGNVPGASELGELLRQPPRFRQLGGPFPAILEVALVSDYEFFVKHGAAAATRTITVLNQVDAIYVDQLNVRLKVVHNQVFETAADPFSNFTSANLFNNFRDAATEFGNWRNGQTGPVKTAGVAHLFSDKTLGLTSGGAGFGFIDTLCSARMGVSISTTPFFDSTGFHAIILAHEFGHNFGAQHDGQAGTSCAAAPAGHIMAPSATGNTFSDCSKTIITSNGESAPCIMDGVPPSTTTTVPPPPACAAPISSASPPQATDCLYILQAAVGLRTCALPCQCAPKGSLPASATDALLCLRASVGGQVVLNCPC